MSFVFIDSKGKVKVTLLPNQIVPPAYRPNSNDPQLTFIYIVPSMRNLMLPLPPTIPPPVGAIYVGYTNNTPKAATVNPNPPAQTIDWSPVNSDDPSIPVSPGQNYITPSGMTIYIAQGQPIPADWKAAGQITNLEAMPTFPVPPPEQNPDDWTPVNSDDPTLPVSPGQNYVSGDGKTIYLAAGTLIPAGWLPITSLVDLEPMPTFPDDNTSSGSGTLPNAWQIAAKIGTVIGVVGISYVGYLYLFKPAEIRHFLVRYEELKTLIVDTSQMLIAIGILVAISFVSYEFAVSYAAKGTFVGAIADMIARGIEEFVTILFDVLGDLIKEAWEYIVDSIKDVFSFKVNL